jgi:hypothetical protein
VLDRPRLEKLSCECYRVVKIESDRLLRSTGGASQRFMLGEQVAFAAARNYAPGWVSIDADHGFPNV